MKNGLSSRVHVRGVNGAVGGEEAIVAATGGRWESSFLTDDPEQVLIYSTKAATKD
jgi:hypothetical protein